MASEVVLKSRILKDAANALGEANTKDKNDALKCVAKSLLENQKHTRCK